MHNNIASYIECRIEERQELEDRQGQARVFHSGDDQPFYVCSLASRVFPLPPLLSLPLLDFFSFFLTFLLSCFKLLRSLQGVFDLDLTCVYIPCKDPLNIAVSSGPPATFFRIRATPNATSH
jgi:hypothetical protein